MGSAPGSPKQQMVAPCKIEPEPHSVGLVARSRSGSFGTSAPATRSGVASAGGNVSVDFKLRVATALDALEARSTLLDERTARLDERTVQLAEGTHRLESLVMGELAQLRRCVGEVLQLQAGNSSRASAPPLPVPRACI